MNIFDSLKARQAEAAALAKITFRNHPSLLKIKPRSRYVFHSDYFEIDDYYACILAFHHRDGATDNFGAFWGVNFIPQGLGLAGVTTVNLSGVRRLGESWLAEHQTQAEGVAEMNENSQAQAGTNQTRHRARRASEDLRQIATELNDGASYLNVQDRLLVKAPSLEMLERAVEKIERLYMDRFGTLSAMPYIGEQQRELADFFASNKKKKGKGFYYTSTEYAGAYNLVTHGLEDARGEYVGRLIGDVNASAVLLDVDNYSHHLVIAHEGFDESRGRAHMADMWASKISQAALLNNHRVVHFILDDCNLDCLGPKFSRITSNIDLNHGDINMMEFFGLSVDEELAIYARGMQKLILMAEQAYETTAADRSIIRATLEKVATRFYVDQKMWHENAKENRNQLRIVGIPHEEVPRLQDFVLYIDTARKRELSSDSRDEEQIHALNVLSGVFHNLLATNGDLFNCITTDAINGAFTGSRVVYDFGHLLARGRGVAMAQFVNVLGFAIDSLKAGDVVIVHGAEHIAPGVRDYVSQQFGRLWDVGGRVVWCYNSMEKMLADVELNRYDKADYTVLGPMAETTVDIYQKRMGVAIPPDLARLVTNRNANLCYIRRGWDNIVFEPRLLLDPARDRMGVRPKRTRRTLSGGLKKRKEG